MYLFIVPSQTVIGNILPSLWQRCLEKPLMCNNPAATTTDHAHYLLKPINFLS